MRVMTILGTRPEIVRLSLIIEHLDRHTQHTLVHTGQNTDPTLSQLLFDELGVRPPDLHLGIQAASFGAQLGQIIEHTERVLLQVQPHRVLILGDTNSGLSAIVARRLGIPVFHLEAGNRCFDDRVPEETNRRLIDHISTVLMPYTQRGRENLLAEGIESRRILVTGNPIKDVLDRHAESIDRSDILTRIGVQPREFLLVTLHRAENVDVPHRLHAFVEAMSGLHQAFGLPVICSTHPRTRERLRANGLDTETSGVRFMPPFGFCDFVRLEKTSRCILSDSGTVQEEACLFGVPNVTLRDTTERPETLECGSNVLGGADPSTIIALAKMVVEHHRPWEPPREYQVQGVANTVCRIIMSHSIEPEGWARAASGAQTTAPFLTQDSGALDPPCNGHGVD